MSDGVTLDPSAVRWREDGLVPGIVQDASDGRVLMLGYLDREALVATLETRLVHFHSRSRGRLWRKGETSGNVLRLLSVELDCDGDALLLVADATGPTCHTGTRSCFDTRSGEPDASKAREHQGFEWLETLWSTIGSRRSADPASSYTARLLAGGVDAVTRKVVEEATEVLIAAKDDAAASPSDAPVTRGALTSELADLWFHALVLCAERSIAPSAVIRVLLDRSASAPPPDAESLPPRA